LNNWRLAGVKHRLLDLLALDSKLLLSVKFPPSTKWAASAVTPATPTADSQEESTMDSTYNNEMSWASWMTPVDDEPTREAWLLSAIDRMARSLFPAFKQPRWP
jgi:hypothetical protein